MPIAYTPSAAGAVTATSSDGAAKNRAAGPGDDATLAAVGGPSRRHRDVDVLGGGGRHRGDRLFRSGFSTSIVSSELDTTHTPFV
jgi:hypothetical protein